MQTVLRWLAEGTLEREWSVCSIGGGWNIKRVDGPGEGKYANGENGFDWKHDPRTEVGEEVLATKQGLDGDLVCVSAVLLLCKGSQTECVASQCQSALLYLCMIVTPNTRMSARRITPCGGRLLLEGVELYCGPSHITISDTRHDTCYAPDLIRWKGGP